jgi:hypothetical protein
LANNLYLAIAQGILPQTIKNWRREVICLSKNKLTKYLRTGGLSALGKQTMAQVTMEVPIFITFKPAIVGLLVRADIGKGGGL